MNLARGTSGRRRRRSSGVALTKRVELVELVATQPTRTFAARKYTVRVGKLGIEIGDDFDAGTLRRLVAVLSAC